jgi:hypothetical protein
VFISEVTVIPNEEVDPVQLGEELAYMFGIPIIANENGLSMRIEWGFELSVAGLLPYMPPLVIAGLMMYVTMASIFEERRKEFVTLATLGLDPSNTFKVFLAEALLLGLMGTFLGFFGSYIIVLALSYATGSLGGTAVSNLSLTPNWSMFSILVALFTGVVMVFLGGYIPAVRTQGVSLMGRVKKKALVGELVSEGNVTSYALPIRINIQNSEMLYTFIRETLGKFKQSFIDSHSIKGEMYGDGTFKVSFVYMSRGQALFVPFEIKGERKEEILTPIIEFPSRFKSYEQTRRILCDLEIYALGFTTWKDMQRKIQIIRKAPKKQKSVEEILNEILAAIDQIKDFNKKLKILEARKGKISEEIYEEFKEKYTNLVEEETKALRTKVIGLESYYSELQEETKKISTEIERTAVVHSLGEISQEVYVKTCGPLEAKQEALKRKIAELEEIFEFIKRPIGIT